MKSLNGMLLAACLALAPMAAHTHTVDESDFVWVSDLARDGFEPFAVSSSGKASFGMMKGTDMYLCFLADHKEDQEVRRNVLIANMKDDKADNTMPNIPVACVLAQ